LNSGSADDFLLTRRNRLILTSCAGRSSLKRSQIIQAAL
jgi:hypothetical protein